MFRPQGGGGGAGNPGGGNGELQWHNGGLFDGVNNYTSDGTDILYNGVDIQDHFLHYNGHINNANSFDSRKFYIPQLDNLLFQGDKRFTVTASGTSHFTEARLFDNDYEATGVTVDAGGTGIITIDLLDKNEFDADGITYVEGYVYLSFYSTDIPTSVSGRAKDRDGVWHAMENAENIGLTAGRAVWRLRITATYNYMVMMELTIVAQPGVQSTLVEIEYNPDRPSGHPVPMVSRYYENTLYKTLNFNDSTNTTVASITENGAAEFALLTVGGGFGGGEFVRFEDATFGTNYISMGNGVGAEYILYGDVGASILHQFDGGNVLINPNTQVTGSFKVTGNVGFFGTTPIAKQVSGADLTNSVTSGGVNDTIADFSDLTTYANDAAAIRNDIYQLARKLKQVNDALRDYGLLT